MRKLIGIKKMEKLPVFNTKTYNKFFGEKNIDKWKVFYDYFLDKSLKILDFGCGAGWSIHLGRKFGYDIHGLDVKAWANAAKNFIEFREALGVSKYVKLYDGYGTLPWSDNSFSLIVCRGSFNKFKSKEAKKDEREIILERIGEFSRILYGPKIVVIAGGYFLKFKKEFKKAGINDVYLWNKNSIKQVWGKGA